MVLCLINQNRLFLCHDMIKIFDYLIQIKRYRDEDKLIYYLDDIKILVDKSVVSAIQAFFNGLLKDQRICHGDEKGGVPESEGFIIN